MYTDAAHHTRLGSTITLSDLLTSINTCAELRQLNFEFDARLMIKWNPSLDLPMLSRLEQFNFNSQDHPSILSQSLEKYAKPNGRLRALGFAQDLYGFYDFRLLVRGDAELARKGKWT